MARIKIPPELRAEHKRQYNREYYQRTRQKDFRRALQSAPVALVAEATDTNSADTNNTDTKKGA